MDVLAAVSGMKAEEEDGVVLVSVHSELWLYALTSETLSVSEGLLPQPPKQLSKLFFRNC